MGSISALNEHDSGPVMTYHPDVSLNPLPRESRFRVNRRALGLGLVPMVVRLHLPTQQTTRPTERACFESNS